MKGLTAKVFRTYNASTTFENELLSFEFKPNVLQQEKVNAYNAANKKAAELCNHQKAASKNHAVGMAKMALHVSYSACLERDALTFFAANRLVI
jgi:DNA topoisomerase-1